MDCYRGVKSATGPWQCELCEDLFSSRGSGALATNSWEKPYFVAECGLCGGTAGAFRKSVGGQWIHALCAEVNNSLLSAPAHLSLSGIVIRSILLKVHAFSF